MKKIPGLITLTVFAVLLPAAPVVAQDKASLTPTDGVAPVAALEPTGAQSNASVVDRTGSEGRGSDEFKLSYAAAYGQDDGTTSQPPRDSAEPAAGGQDAAGSEDLAKKLQNPVADLISIPFQSNFDLGGGVDIPSGLGRGFLQRVLPRGPARLASRVLSLALRDQPDRDQAFRYTLNFQPVIPISISKDWNLISRTIIPVLYQDDVRGVTSQGGLGDTIQSLFLSPRSTEPFIWGAGPVFLLPTATDDSLGAERWGMGPTGVILKQSGPWTYGILANHIWSFARDDNRKEVNATYLQPFLSYTFKTATTLSFSTESTYDWVGNQWTVPLIGGVSQLVRIGKLPVSLGVNGKYWVEGPDAAPDWGVRFTMTFLLPK